MGAMKTIKAMLPFLKWAVLCSAGMAVMIRFSTWYPKKIQTEVNNAVLDYVTMSGAWDSEYDRFLSRELFGSETSRIDSLFKVGADRQLETYYEDVLGKTGEFASRVGETQQEIDDRQMKQKVEEPKAKEYLASVPSQKKLTSSYYKFYLFHIKNLGEVLRGQEKPKLAEKGPYIYEIYGSKYDVQFNLAKQEVSYKVEKKINFIDKTIQTGAADAYAHDITTLNLPALQLLKNLANTDIASKSGLTDTFIAGTYANEAFAEFRRYLRGPFVAQLKKEALGRHLSRLYRSLRRLEVPRTLRTRYPELLVREVPATLLNVYARVREAKITEVVTQVYQQLASTRVYSTVGSILRRVTVLAVPRVLHGMYQRLQTEALPVLLDQLTHRISESDRQVQVNGGGLSSATPYTPPAVPTPAPTIGAPTKRPTPSAGGPPSENGYKNHAGAITVSELLQRSYSRAKHSVTPEAVRMSYRDVRLKRLPNFLSVLWYSILQEEKELFDRAKGYCATASYGQCTPTMFWLNTTGVIPSPPKLDMSMQYFVWHKPFNFPVHHGFDATQGSEEVTGRTPPIYDWELDTVQQSKYHAIYGDLSSIPKPSQEVADYLFTQQKSGSFLNENHDNGYTAWRTYLDGKLANEQAAELGMNTQVNNEKAEEAITNIQQQITCDLNISLCDLYLGTGGDGVPATANATKVDIPALILAQKTAVVSIEQLRLVATWLRHWLDHELLHMDVQGVWRKGKPLLGVSNYDGFGALDPYDRTGRQAYESAKAALSGDAMKNVKSDGFQLNTDRSKLLMNVPTAIGVAAQGHFGGISANAVEMSDEAAAFFWTLTATGTGSGKSTSGLDYTAYPNPDSASGYGNALGQPFPGSTPPAHVVSFMNETAFVQYWLPIMQMDENSEVATKAIVVAGVSANVTTLDVLQVAAWLNSLQGNSYITAIAQDQWSRGRCASVKANENVTVAQAAKAAVALHAALADGTATVTDETREPQLLCAPTPVALIPTASTVDLVYEELDHPDSLYATAGADKDYGMGSGSATYSMTGVTGGWEMNLEGKGHLVLTQDAADYLLDASNQYAITNYVGYAAWAQCSSTTYAPIREATLRMLTTEVPNLTVEQAKMIAEYVEGWTKHPLVKARLLERWRTGTCTPPTTLTTNTTTPERNVSGCKASTVTFTNASTLNSQVSPFTTQISSTTTRTVKCSSFVVCTTFEARDAEIQEMGVTVTDAQFAGLQTSNAKFKLAYKIPGGDTFYASAHADFGGTTPGLAVNASADDVAAAIEAMAGMGAGAVTVERTVASGTGYANYKWAITYTGKWAGVDMPYLGYSCASDNGCDYANLPIGHFSVTQRQPGASSTRKKEHTVYDAVVKSTTKTDTAYSCDVLDMDMDQDSAGIISGQTTVSQGGFEINPQALPALKLPPAAVSYLWDSSQPFSFLATPTRPRFNVPSGGRNHTYLRHSPFSAAVRADPAAGSVTNTHAAGGGYQLWLAASADGYAAKDSRVFLAEALKGKINRADAVAALVAGVQRGITTAHVEAVADWIAAHTNVKNGAAVGREWVQQLLRDDWRFQDGKHSTRSDAMQTLLPLQLSPFQHWSTRTAWEYQYGLEMSHACSNCGPYPQLPNSDSALSPAQVTASVSSRMVPTAAAKYLWDSSSTYGFLNSEGYKVWARAAMAVVTTIQNAQAKAAAETKEGSTTGDLKAELRTNNVTGASVELDRPLLCDILCGTETESACSECSKKAMESLAKQFNPSAASTKSKIEGTINGWKPWMSSASVWVLSLVGHPLTRNDQLLHWLDATCHAPEPSTSTTSSNTFDLQGGVGTGPADPVPAFVDPDSLDVPEIVDLRLCVDGVAEAVTHSTAPGQQYQMGGYGPQSPQSRTLTTKTTTVTNCSAWTLLNSTLLSLTGDATAGFLNPGGGRALLTGIDMSAVDWDEEAEEDEDADERYLTGSYSETTAPSPAPTAAPSVPPPTSFKMRLSGYSSDTFDENTQLAVRSAIAAIVGSDTVTSEHVVLSDIKAAAVARRLGVGTNVVTVQGITFSITINTASDSVAVLAQTAATKLVTDSGGSDGSDSIFKPALVAAIAHIQKVPVEAVQLPPGFGLSVLAAADANKAFAPLPPPPMLYKVTIKQTVTVTETLAYSCDAIDLMATVDGVQGGWELGVHATKEKFAEYTNTGLIAGTSNKLMHSVLKSLPKGISLDHAVQLFDTNHPSSFITYQGFVRWRDSYRDTKKRDAILDSLQPIATDIDYANPAVRFSVEQLELVREWLFGWVENSYLLQELDKVWAGRNKDSLDVTGPLDLDEDMTGIQGGFEANWINKPGYTPSYAHAAYLWNPSQTYSFLNPGLRYDPVTGGPTGFYAWRAVFSGNVTATTELRLGGVMEQPDEMGQYPAGSTKSGVREGAQGPGVPTRLCADKGSAHEKGAFGVSKCMDSKGSHSAVHLVQQEGNETLAVLIGNDTNTLPPCKGNEAQASYQLYISFVRDWGMVSRVNEDGDFRKTCEIAKSIEDAKNEAGFQVHFGRGVYSAPIQLYQVKNAPSTQDEIEAQLYRAMLERTSAFNYLGMTDKLAENRRRDKTLSVSEQLVRAYQTGESGAEGAHGEYGAALNESFRIIGVRGVERSGCNWTFVIDANLPWRYVGDNVTLRHVTNSTAALHQYATEIPTWDHTNGYNGAGGYGKLKGAEEVLPQRSIREMKVAAKKTKSKKDDYFPAGALQLTASHHADNMTMNITSFYCPPRDGMSLEQVSQVAEWLMAWADNELLLKFVHESWSTLNVSTQLSTGIKHVQPTALSSGYTLPEGYPNRHAALSEPLIGFEAARGPYKAVPVADAEAKSSSWAPTVLSPDDPLLPHQLHYLFDVTKEYSVFNPLGLDTWREAHDGPAPETSIWPQRRNHHTGSMEAAERISASTNNIPACPANSSTSTTIVDLEQWRFEYSWRKEGGIAVNSSNSSSSDSGGGDWEGPTCLVGDMASGPDYNSEMLKVMSGERNDTINFCTLRYWSIVATTETPVTSNGFQGTVTETKTEWWVEGTDSNSTAKDIVGKWQLNTTVTVKTEYTTVCLPSNGMSVSQVRAVAAWLMSWAEHPLVSHRLQSRWWRQNEGAVKGGSGLNWGRYEDGFALRRIYPGESFMNNLDGKQRVKSGGGNISASDEMMLPVGTMAALWDPASPVSFLNETAFRKLWLPLLQNQDREQKTTRLRAANSDSGIDAADLNDESQDYAGMAGAWQEIAAMLPDSYSTLGQMEFTSEVAVINTTTGEPVPAQTRPASSLADTTNGATTGKGSQEREQIGYKVVMAVRRWLESWAVSPYNQVAVLEQWRTGTGSKKTKGTSRNLQEQKNKMANNQDTEVERQLESGSYSSGSYSSTPSAPTATYAYGWDATSGNSYHPVRASWTDELSRFDLIRHAQFKQGSGSVQSTLKVTTQANAPGGCATECLERGAACTGFGYREEEEFKRTCWFSGGADEDGKHAGMTWVSAPAGFFSYGQQCVDLDEKWSDVVGTTCQQYSIAKNSATDNVLVADTYPHEVPDGQQLLCTPTGEPGQLWGRDQTVLDNWAVVAHDGAGGTGILGFKDGEEGLKSAGEKRGIKPWIPLNQVLGVGSAVKMSDYATYTAEKRWDVNQPGGYEVTRMNLADAAKVCCGCGGGKKIAAHYYDKRMGAIYPSKNYAAMGMPGGAALNLPGNGYTDILVTAASENQARYEYDHVAAVALREETDRHQCTRLGIISDSSSSSSSSQPPHEVCTDAAGTVESAGGWELGASKEAQSLLLNTPAGIGPGTAALLWDPSNRWSLLHYDGYAAWMQGGTMAKCDSTNDPLDSHSNAPSPGASFPVTASDSATAKCTAVDGVAELKFRDSIAGGKCNARGVQDATTHKARQQAANEYLWRQFHPSQRQHVNAFGSGKTKSIGVSQTTGGGWGAKTTALDEYPSSCVVSQAKDNLEYTQSSLNSFVDICLEYYKTDPAEMSFEVDSVRNWLLQMLDNPVLHRSDALAYPDLASSLSSSSGVDSGEAVRQLAYLQWGSGSATKQVWKRQVGEMFREYSGRDSVHSPATNLYWQPLRENSDAVASGGLTFQEGSTLGSDQFAAIAEDETSSNAAGAATATVVIRNANLNVDGTGVAHAWEEADSSMSCSGYEEVSAFCQYGYVNATKKYGTQYILDGYYDEQWAKCSSSGTKGKSAGVFLISLAESMHLLDVLADRTQVTLNTAPASLKLTRGALMTMSLLDQPYSSQGQCEEVGEVLGDEFDSNANSNMQKIGDGGCKLLTSTGSNPVKGWWTTSAWAGISDADVLQDLQQYAKYIATRFVLMQEVVGLEWTNPAVPTPPPAIPKGLTAFETDAFKANLMRAANQTNAGSYYRGGGVFTTQTAASLVLDGWTDPMVAGVRRRGITRLVPDADVKETSGINGRETQNNLKLQASSTDLNRAWGESFSYFQVMHNSSGRAVTQGVGASKVAKPAAGSGRQLITSGEKIPDTATGDWDLVSTDGRQNIMQVNQLHEWAGAVADGCPEPFTGEGLEGGHCSDGSQLPPLLGDVEGKDRSFDATSLESIHVWQPELRKALRFTANQITKSPARDTIEFISEGLVSISRYDIKLRRYRVAPGAGVPLTKLDHLHHGLPLALSNPHFLAPAVNSSSTSGTSAAIATLESAKAANVSCGRTGCGASLAAMKELFGAAADVVHVEGMVPIAIRHESVVDVEPISGITMNLKRRQQLNVDYQLWKKSVWYDRLWMEGRQAAAAATTGSAVATATLATGVTVTGSVTWMPLYWMEEGGSISSKQADAFKNLVYTPLWYKKKVPVICLLVGACAISVALVFVMMGVHKRLSVAPLFANKKNRIGPNGLTAEDERFNAALGPNSAFRRSSATAVAPSNMGPQGIKGKKAGTKAGAKAGGAAPSMPSANPFAAKPKKAAPAAKAMPASNPFAKGGTTGKLGGSKIKRGGGEVEKTASKKIVKGGGQKIVRGGGAK